MHCLKGYVIPRTNKATVRAAATQSERGRSRIVRGTDMCLPVAQINSIRCIHCKNCHDPKNYCFRLKTVGIMPKRKRSSRYRDTSGSSDSESSDSEDARDYTDARDSSVDKSEDSKKDQTDDDKPKEYSFGPPFGSLEGFYDGKRRIDAHDVKLILRPETVKMYFEKLLADGKMDYESARKLHKKYYMADKDFTKIAPPSLSATKLHEIQSHDLGGVHSRLMGIHISMRTALKVILRAYEGLAGVSETISCYKPAHVYTSDKEVSDRFILPSRRELLAEITEADVENGMPVDESDVIELVKQKIMLTRLSEIQANMCVNLLAELHEADSVACLGQKQQVTLEELLWDGLQYLGQLDLTIKDAREAKIEEYFTAGFKSSLKAANRDRTVKSARHKKDVLLHPKLDKMVKEESRSNTKVVSNS